MLHSYNDLVSFAIRGPDGHTGRVDDIYFDDSSWKIRYVVAQSGFLLTGRQSLLGTDLLGRPDMANRSMPTELSKEQMQSIAPPEADAPVSRQQDGTVPVQDLFSWAPLLSGSHVHYSPERAMLQLGLGAGDESNAAERAEAERPLGDPHLRSMAEVEDYSVAARDGEFGSVLDFLIDPDTWQLKYLVIDTGNWLPGRRVVVTTDWVSDVDWPGKRLHVSVDRQTIEDAPRLREIEELRISEARMMAERYGAIGYWPI